jgi:hypothetical protein
MFEELPEYPAVTVDLVVCAVTLRGAHQQPKGFALQLAEAFSE